MSSRLTAALAIGCLVIAGVTSAEAMRGEPQESRAVAHPEALQVAVKVTPTTVHVNPGIRGIPPVAAKSHRSLSKGSGSTMPPHGVMGTTVRGTKPKPPVQ
jgi:hypothetical protein